MKINKQGEFVDEEPPNPYASIMKMDMELERIRSQALEQERRRHKKK